MDGKTRYLNSLQEANGTSFWKIKGIGGGGKRRKHQDKRFSVTEFLHENGRKVVGRPGGGFGVGCGVGLGMGMVGGVGAGGGSMWNHLRMVFGIGIGCGVGLGFGYGQGIGIGFSLHSLRSHFFPPTKAKSKKSILVPI